MMNKLKPYLPFILLVLSLFFLWFMRWESLNHPYFWDELGVYGKGVQYLVEHGIGFFPRSLPPEISRGHPLLLYTVHASVLHLLGNEFFISHAFSLLISSATLIATYLLAKQVLPSVLAAACSVLLVAQNIFLAQSTLVIPEMTIALLSTLSLLFYFKKRYLVSILILCVGVLVKESVILIAAFLGFVHLCRLIYARKLFQKLPSLLLFTLPLLVFLIFLQIQKLQNGWYFFPYHTEIVQDGAFSGFFEKLNTHFKFFFYKQGRNQWIFAGILALLSIPFNQHKRKFLLLFGFYLFNLVMFSFAFYMERYLLYLYPVLIILIVQGLYFVSGGRKIISLVLVLLFASISIKQLQDLGFQYDVSLAYEDLLDIQIEAVDALCALEDDSIFIGSNFPINMSLDDAALGYLNPACEKRIKQYALNNKPKYMLLYKSPPFGGYEPLQQFVKGHSEIHLYQLAD